jgi:hypothetical protein
MSSALVEPPPTFLPRLLRGVNRRDRPRRNALLLGARPVAPASMATDAPVAIVAPAISPTAARAMLFGSFVVVSVHQARTRPVPQWLVPESWPGVDGARGPSHPRRTVQTSGSLRTPTGSDRHPGQGGRSFPRPRRVQSRSECDGTRWPGRLSRSPVARVRRRLNRPTIGYGTRGTTATVDTGGG